MDETMGTVDFPETETGFGLPGHADWILSRMQHTDRDVLVNDRERSFRGTANDPCLIAVSDASGAWIRDHEGRRYLDLYGNNCHHIGYRHPRLVRALHEQIDALAFVPRGLTNRPAAAFAEHLAALVGWPGAKIVSARSGADAIEIALAIARAHTGRYKTISFYDSYHGRSAGALSVGGRYADQRGLGPLLPGAIHVPPYYRFGAALLGQDHEPYARHSLAAMRFAFEQEREIAAVLGETIRNSPFVPPDWYWPEVRRLCDAHGALLILDEVATGLGKTGWLFNYRRFDVRPDMVVLGKALGGTAMPLSAVVADGRLDSAPHLNIGYFTHEKNPLCAAAGDVTLSIIAEEDLVMKARSLGLHLRERLDELKARHPSIGEIRGAGLMTAIDFTGDAVAAAQRAALIHRLCIERGLLPMLPRGRSITLSAPLIIERSELDGAVEILAEAISAAAR